MLSFKDFYTESTNPLRVLYHYTKLPNAANVVKMNKFALAEQDDTGEEMFPQYKYYLSTARSMTSNYIREKAGQDSTFPVIFVLDASKLSDKGYVIKPIHDYTTLSPSGISPRDMNREARLNQRLDTSKLELEDRILTNKPAIDNANSYIKSIHVCTMDDYVVDMEDAMKQPMHGTRCVYTPNQAFNEFSKSGIPTYVYADEKDFLLLNQRKAKLLNT